MERPKIAIGYRVGALTVTEQTAQRKCGYAVWRCRCDCGGEIDLDTRYLQRGTIADCGCKTKVRPGMIDLTGKHFGKLVCLHLSDERMNAATRSGCAGVTVETSVSRRYHSCGQDIKRAAAVSAIRR